MTHRAKKLIVLGLAAVGVLLAATYRPFGGTAPTAPVPVHNPEQTAHALGMRIGQGLAMEDVRVFKTPERVAQHFAIREGIPSNVRDVWCAAFAKGFSTGMKLRGESL